MDEATTALRLEPDLAQAHAAMGLALYWGRRDYQGGLEQFRVALAGLPNDVWIWGWVSAVNRRLGNWDEAMAAFEKAAQLDPRNANLFFDQGGRGYQVMHRYAEAVRSFDQALRLAPDLYPAAVFKGIVYAQWRGQLDTLRRVLDGIPGGAGLGALGSVASQRVRLFLWERRPDSMLRLVAVAREPVFDGYSFYLPATLYAAWAHQLRGDRVAARAAFDSARVLLDSVEHERPDDWRVHAARGLALAGLGSRAEAQQEAAWLRASPVYRDDHLDGPTIAEDRARILAQVGGAGAAVAEIQRLLGEPSFLTVPTLRLDPLWDPIRSDPRFQALLAQ